MFDTLHAHYHLPRLTELRVLFAAHGVANVAGGMVGVFVPIYLYTIGYSLTEVFLYLTFAAVCWSLQVYPAMRQFGRFNSHYLIAAGITAAGLQYAVLSLAADTVPGLMAAGALSGTSAAFYWPAFRMSFAASLHHRKPGRTVGSWSAVTLLAAATAPVFGGLIAQYLGAPVMFSVAMVLFTIAAGLLFTTRTRSPEITFRLRRGFLRKSWRDLFANAMETINDYVTTNVWPLYVFFLIPSFVGVGLLTSATALAMIAVSVFVGRHTERRGAKHYLRQGVAVTGLINGGRLLVQNAAHVLGINLIGGIGRALYSTAYNTRYYEHIEEDETGTYLFGMQLAGSLGLIALCGVITILSLFMGEQAALLTGVLLALPASLGIVLIR